MDMTTTIQALTSEGFISLGDLRVFVQKTEHLPPDSNLEVGLAPGGEVAQTTSQFDLLRVYA